MKVNKMMWELEGFRDSVDKGGFVWGSDIWVDYRGWEGVSYVKSRRKVF